jgi:hypothetical protein
MRATFLGLWQYVIYYHLYAIYSTIHFTTDIWGCWEQP